MDGSSAGAEGQGTGSGTGAVSDAAVEAPPAHAASSRVARLIGRVPNPLTLERWATLFRVAGLLKGAYFLLSFVGILLSMVSIFRSFGAAGNPLGSFSLFSVSQLKALAGVLMLLAAADLLRYLAGRRENLQLGRRLGGLLWFLAAAEAVSMIFWFLPFLALRPWLESFHYALINAGWALFYAAVAMVASRFVRSLEEAREHAVPSEGYLLYAARKLLRVPGPAGAVLPRFLFGGGILLIAAGVVLAGHPLRLMYTSLLTGLPPGASGAGSPGMQLLNMVQMAFLPGIVLLTFGTWLQRSRPSAGRLERFGELLPGALWALAVIRGVRFLVHLAVFPPTGFAWISMVLSAAESLVWMLPFIGAGYAVRTLSRLAREGE